MTNAAAIQTAGQNLDVTIIKIESELKGLKDRSLESAATCLLGLVVALIASVPCFALSMQTTELLTSGIMSVSGVADAARAMTLLYSVGLIPVLLLLAKKDNVPLLLGAVVLISTIMGCLFQLSF